MKKLKNEKINGQNFSFKKDEKGIVYSFYKGKSYSIAMGRTKEEAIKITKRITDQSFVKYLNKFAFQQIIDIKRATQLINERMPKKKKASWIFRNLSNNSSSGKLFEKNRIDPTDGVFFANINFLSRCKGNRITQHGEYKSIEILKKIIKKGIKFNSVPGFSIRTGLVEEGNHRIETLRQLRYKSCPVQLWDGWQ